MGAGQEGRPAPDPKEWPAVEGALREELSSMCDELRVAGGRDAERLTERIRAKAAEIRSLRGRWKRAPAGPPRSNPEGG